MSQVLAIIAAGLVENVILGSPEDFPGCVDVSGLTPRPGVGWTYDGSEFAPPEGGSPVERRKITNLAFDLRFTEAERVAVELASLDNPGAPADERAVAAAIRVGTSRAAKAAFVDLDDPVTRGGVLQFESFGLLAPGRAAEILDSPVEPRERPS